MTQTLGGRAPRDAWFWGLLALGAVGLANAGWMLLDPLWWYHDLPAGVPDFGAFNPHFVRDIGCAFLMVGTAQVWAAFVPAYRLPLVGATTVFLVAHAGLHVYDTARDAVDAHHWWLDAPGVYAPAVASLVLVRPARPPPSHPNGGSHATRAREAT